MEKYLKPIFILPGVIALIVVCAVAWYLISPLFIQTQVNEARPLSAEQARAAEPPAMKTAMAEQSPTFTVSEAMPAAGPVVIAKGDFYNVVHEGHGTAEILKLTDGSFVLRLENFQTLNGPDLRVYLAPQAKIDPNVGAELDGAIDLGKLKATQGAQNYSLPANTNPAQFKSVVIWCQPFRVPFIAAPLNAVSARN